jgi:hypothetical protein
MPAKVIQNGTGIAYWFPDLTQVPFQVGICMIPNLGTGTVDCTFDNINLTDSGLGLGNGIGTAAGSATWFNIIAAIGTSNATANFTTPVQAFRVNLQTSVATGLITVWFNQAGLQVG